MAADDAELIALSHGFVRALGVPVEDASFMVRDVMRQARKQSDPLDATRTHPTRIASMVLVDRTLGGIPVVGDRLTLTFDAIDGIKRIDGRWRKIDYSRSTLATTMASDAILEVAAMTAAAEMADAGVSTSDIHSAHLRTVFEHDASDPDRVELRGEVAMRFHPIRERIPPGHLVRFSLHQD